MALAHDDIWQKFDLFGERSGGQGPTGRPVGLWDGISDWLVAGETDAVPDISDLLAGPEAEGPECCGRAVGRAGGQKLSRLLSSSSPAIDFEAETLRHDCMWSGHCPSEEHRGAGPSCLHTPGQSEGSEDSSDPDDTLSDCEAALGLVADPDSGSSANPTYTDHCYSGPSLLLTPAQSSEDEEGPRPPGREGPRPPAREGPRPPGREGPRPPAREGPRPPGSSRTGGPRPTIRTRPPRPAPSFPATKAPAAKFKFHMKFVAGPRVAGRRSLLRPPRPPRLAESPAPAKPRRLPVAVERVEAAGGRDVRDLHNSMERQRRVDLKNAFDALKLCVPEISESERASKLVILERAAHFCKALLRREVGLAGEREKERRRNTLMKKKLALLRTQYKTSLSKCTRRNLL